MFVLISEIVIVTTILIDVILKTTAAGFRNFIKKKSNLFDCFIILANLLTVFLYFEFHSISQEIEDISVVLLIAIRNLTQLIRIVIFYKYQNSVKVGVLVKFIYFRKISEKDLILCASCKTKS